MWNVQRKALILAGLPSVWRCIGFSTGALLVAIAILHRITCIRISAGGVFQAIRGRALNHASAFCWRPDSGVVG
jgi:hypothetical protein